MTGCWIDGLPDDRVPADDRALAYGDGLFETMAVLKGAIRLLPWHLERLSEGCRRLSLPLPLQPLEAELRARAAALDSGILKLVISRGSGPRGYAPPPAPAVRRILFAAPQPPGFAAGDGPAIRVRTCDTPVSVNPALAGLKHLNRLPQVLARAEWRDPAIAEGLMLDVDGNVVCATAANVFAVIDGVLVTPALSRAGVAGVMRRAVLEAAGRAGCPARERALPRDALAGASELMLSSALTGLRSVAALDGRRVPGTAVGGALRAALEDVLETETR